MPSLGPDAPGDALYRFEAPEIKAVNHRLDCVFWPHAAATGAPDRPVVLLEVQMHAKPGFKHRLAAQTVRFPQLHPHVQHLAWLWRCRTVASGRPCGAASTAGGVPVGVHWLSLEKLQPKARA